MGEGSCWGRRVLGGREGSAWGGGGSRLGEGEGGGGEEEEVRSSRHSHPRLRTGEESGRRWGPGSHGED